MIQKKIVFLRSENFLEKYVFFTKYPHPLATLNALTPWPLSQEERGDYSLVIRFQTMLSVDSSHFFLGGWEGVNSPSEIIIVYHLLRNAQAVKHF